MSVSIRNYKHIILKQFLRPLLDNNDTKKKNNTNIINIKIKILNKI